MTYLINAVHLNFIFRKIMEKPNLSEIIQKNKTPFQ